MNLDTRLTPVGIVSLLLVGSAAGCYTYNIYQLDGDGGAASTTSSSAASSSSGSAAGGGGASSSDASSVASTASASSSNSTADSSSSSGTPTCSQGFPPTTITGEPCDQPSSEPSYFVNNATELDKLCYLQRDPMNEPAPTFDVNANGFELNSECSEWTPLGYGPFIYREAAPATSQRFVVVLARLNFQDFVTEQFHGAGVMIRQDEPPAFASRYALISLMREDGQMVFSHHVWTGMGNPTTTELASLPANATIGAVALCYDQTDKTVKAYATTTVVPAVPLTWSRVGPAQDVGFDLPLSKPYQVGAIAHAFAGQENVDVLVTGLSVNYRAPVEGTCAAALPTQF